MNIYVGNLPYRITNQELEDLFSAFGSVQKANVIMDRETNRSKGYGFVEMDEASDAEEAIKALDGSEIQGRNIKVNQALPKGEKPKPRPKSW